MDILKMCSRQARHMLWPHRSLAALDGETGSRQVTQLTLGGSEPTVGIEGRGVGARGSGFGGPDRRWGAMLTVTPA